MIRLCRGALATVVLCLSGSCVTTTPSRGEPAAPQPIRLTIVGTNDLHGWVSEQREVFPQGTIRAGGAATLAGYLRLLRAANPGGVLLLDGGDMFQGTLVSNLTEGKVVIDAMNLLGYDAAAIGNHEFDYGPDGPVSAATSPSMDPFGALKARIADARFPMLAANIYEKASGARPAWLRGDGTVIVERHGVKVGIVGLITPQTPTVTLPINVETLRFAPLADEARAAAASLRQRGAELVVAVMHAGGKCTDAKDPKDTSSCDSTNGEVFQMLAALPAGTLDAVVAGHTHAQIGHFVNGTPVIQSFALGKAFGTIELFLDPATHRVLAERTEVHSGQSVCHTVDRGSGSCDAKELKKRGVMVQPEPATYRGQPVVPDEAIAAALVPAEARVEALQNKPLGVQVVQALGRNYDAESTLGSLLADSLRAMTGADVVLLNPGGLRADLKQGPLTYGRIYEVLPFDNNVATLSLTGAELRTLLAGAYGGRKGVFQVSGAELTLDRCPGPRRLLKVLIGGKPIDERASYRVVLPDFLARGGDGLGPALASVSMERIDYGANRDRNLRDELVDYWQAHKDPLVPPPPGRVDIVENGPCAVATSPSAQP